MISTGNDIVALKAINIARTKQPNFYKKIISVSEKDLYDQQLSGKILLENFVWLLWSIKESVYKYLQRSTPELVFSPTKITVSKLYLPPGDQATELEGQGFDEDAVYKGIAMFGDQVLYSRSIITGEFIFSVVSHEDDFANTCWGIQLTSSTDPAYQSRAVRAFLGDKLNRLFPDSVLSISKSIHGYPILLKDGIETPMPVSLAHHDHYVAYSSQIQV
jgi:phosphopantetheinyl transferase (holo-ACP synthase)